MGDWVKVGFSAQLADGLEVVEVDDDRVREELTRFLGFARVANLIISDVNDGERVIITRNGRDAAVVISTEDLAELEETIAVLSDPDALRDIREADAAYASGDVVRSVDAVRNLRR